MFNSINILIIVISIFCILLLCYLYKKYFKYKEKRYASYGWNNDKHIILYTDKMKPGICVVKITTDFTINADYVHSYIKASNHAWSEHKIPLDSEEAKNVEN